MGQNNDLSRTIFSSYPDVVDVGLLSQMIGVSKKTAYQLLASEKIKSVKIGRTYKIPKIFIVQYLVGINHLDS